MGDVFRFQCKTCGHSFDLEVGGGFCGFYIFCNKCGKPKSIDKYKNFLKETKLTYDFALQQLNRLIYNLKFKKKKENNKSFKSPIPWLSAYSQKEPKITIEININKDILKITEDDKIIMEKSIYRMIPPRRKSELLDELFGICECGGKFRYNSPIRCPKCHSTKLKRRKIGWWD